MKTFKPEPRDFDMKGLENYLVTINDFDVKTQIGKGGYGEVFYGIHIKTGRKVAIKKLILSKLDGSDLVYFNREVQILASCENYFLLPLIGYSNSYPYIIVTDFVPCGSLFEALRHKPGSPLLTDTMKTKIGLGIAIGMIALHDKNIIHRDLKSLNILISQETLPKICDFGIARFSDSGKDPSCPQKFFTANIGTPHWMAPEILQSGSYTDKVDVFSYAVILWEMLTEALPFQGMKELYQVALKIISGERNPLPLNAPIGLKNLINKLWSQDPELRPDFREVYRSFASHEVYFGNTNHAEIDEFVKRFPMPTKPSEGEEFQFNSENGINSGSYNSNSASFEENYEANKNSGQNQESNKISNTDQHESAPNSQYIDSIRDKLSNGPSKPVRPPKVIQPVKLNICISNPQDKKVQTQPKHEIIPQAPKQNESNQETAQDTNKPAPKPDSKNLDDSIALQEELEKLPPPIPQHQFLYLNKYLTKDNIFLQYFSEEYQPSFLEGNYNDDIIEEEEENEFDINKNIENENEEKTTIDIDQIITLTSSSSDDENYDEILNGSDASVVENFGQLSILFHTLIKNINPSNTNELIDTISNLMKTNNRSIMFTTIFSEISILSIKDPEFANLLAQTNIFDYLPYDRPDLFNDILHIVLSILSKEPEIISDEIMKQLFMILMKNVNDHQNKIKKETQKDFDEIIEKEEFDANYASERKFVINDELTKEVMPFLCILEKIGDNIRYRDSIFKLYEEELELFLNFSQFIDIIFYLSTHFSNFTKLQQSKIAIFSKAISMQSNESFDSSSVIQSGFRSLARLAGTEYTEKDIPINIIIEHLKEQGPQTIECLIIIAHLRSISLSDNLIQALKTSTNFSEQSSFIVSNIVLNLASSSSENEEKIYKSKIWLKILPQHGMKLILYLANKEKYQNEMIGDPEMVNYLIRALNFSKESEVHSKPDLVFSVISFIRYSKKFQSFTEVYSNAGFLHAAVDSTISSNNDKCIDQGLLLFDQLFHEGIWFNDFSYFVEKIAKILINMPQKQAQRSIVVLLALGVMFPQSHPIMKDNEIGKIVSKINISSNSVNYKNNLLQILNQT